MLAAAEAVVKDERTSATGRDTYPKAARRPRALDCIPRKICDAIASDRDR
jgi:hypothetical protein